MDLIGDTQFLTYLKQSKSDTKGISEFQKTDQNSKEPNLFSQSRPTILVSHAYFMTKSFECHPNRAEGPRRGDENFKQFAFHEERQKLCFILWGPLTHL